MSLATTRAPSRMKSSAVARPMPLAAAVTNAVFPASRDIEFSRVVAQRTDLIGSTKNDPANTNTIAEMNSQR